MRAALTLAAALALAGCEHMYGGMDAGRLADEAPATDADLVGIAKRKLMRVGRSLDELTPTIADAGDAWRVHFRPSDPAVLDGGVTVEISKKTRRATRWWADA